jgi:hypothetical protein
VRFDVLDVPEATAVAERSQVTHAARQWGCARSRSPTWWPVMAAARVKPRRVRAR